MYIEHVISTIWVLQISYVREHVRELGKHMHEVREHARQFKVRLSRCLFESSHVHLEIVREYKVLEQKLLFTNLSNANFTNNLGSGAMSVWDQRVESSVGVTNGFKHLFNNGIDA